MRLKAISAAYALIACTSLTAVAQQVTIGQGTLLGTRDNGINVFKAIPYAEPPIGDLRWRAPRPAPRWNGIRNTADFGHDCAQAPFPPDAAPIRTQPSEDCLYLNIWQPAEAGPDALRPVMVWIHGGGFVNGGSSPAVYSGERFARDGIVFVSLNYRLGRFGFFAHPALVDVDFGGNFGFLDQIAALRWVQQNISAFGGNPEQVTVMGESAGGMSIHMLLQSPLARGLYQQVIVQSGGGRSRAVATPTKLEASLAGNVFAHGLDAAALRSMSSEEVTGNLSMFTMGQASYSGPMIDGQTLIGSPLQAAEAGLVNQVPVLIGANSADGFPFVTDKNEVFRSFAEHADSAREIYDPNDDQTGFNVALETSADRLMIEPARAVARALADRQHTWLYRFDYKSPEMGGPFKLASGAPHASEIPYVFDTVDLRHDPLMIEEEASVAATTHQLWVDFATYGTPVPNDPTTWPRYKQADDRVFVIDRTGGRYQIDPFQQRLDFVESIAEQP